MSKYSDALESMQQVRQAKSAQEQPAFPPQPEPAVKKPFFSIDRKETDPRFSVKRRQAEFCEAAVLSSILERWRDGEAVVKTFQRHTLVTQSVPRDRKAGYEELRAAFRALTTNP